MKHRLMYMGFCIVILAAAGAAEGAGRRTTQSKQEVQRKIDVCKLLTSAEIEGVQGERVEEAKLSAQPSGGLLMSQCLYRTLTPAKSVSLALAAPKGQKPRDYWRRQFHCARLGYQPGIRPASANAFGVLYVKERQCGRYVPVRWNGQRAGGK